MSEINNKQQISYNKIGDKMFSINDILKVAKELNIDFTKFSLSEFITGINIELEHGKVNPLTNVTNDNLLTTAKIALAHLNEYPDYYNKNHGLPAFENYLKQFNKNI